MKMNTLSQLIYLLSFSLILGACGGSKTDQDVETSQNTSSDQKVSNTKQDAISKNNEANASISAPAPVPEVPKIGDNLGYGNWYEGTVDDLKIWLYFAQNSEEDGLGAYGYESSKGKSIDLRGESENGPWRLTHTNYEKNTSEEFMLKPNLESNLWEGEWTGKDKKLVVKLSPKTTQPKTAVGFLAAFADAQYPSSYESSSLNTALIEQYYKEKKYGVVINNIQDFIQETYFSAGEEIKQNGAIKIGDTKAMLLFKSQLPNGNYLVFFKTNMEKDFTMSYKGIYYLGTNKEVVCAAVMNKSGKVEHTQAVLSNPDDPYFSDIALNLIKSDQYDVVVTNYMRGDRGARIEDGKSIVSFRVEDNQIVMINK
ncbi:MAG: hypothetical protein MK212_05390 [Saprospiraceae bacterium]|nr:hypothetical protein [Saprospiraceae bacterium]